MFGLKSNAQAQNDVIINQLAEDKLIKEANANGLSLYPVPL